jgi:hypothetical protein
MTYTFDRSQLAPAADPTPEEIQAYREEAIAAEGALKEAVRFGRLGRWQEIMACWRCHNASVWEYIEEEKITKAAWLAQPEISMDRDTFDRRRRQWDRVTEQGLDAAHVQHLAPKRVELGLRGLRFVGGDLQQMLADAKTLGWNDFKATYTGKNESKSDPKPGPIKEKKPPTRPELDQKVEDHLTAVKEAERDWEEVKAEKPRDGRVRVWADTIDALDVELYVGRTLIERHPEEADQIRRERILELDLTEEK